MQCSPGWYYRWQARYALPTSTEERIASDCEILCWALVELDKNLTISREQLFKQAVARKDSYFKVLKIYYYYYGTSYLFIVTHLLILFFSYLPDVGLLGL
jgi:hypothetical protein